MDPLRGGGEVRSTGDGTVKHKVTEEYIYSLESDREIPSDSVDSGMRIP
jgi:hypothetical protein